MTSKRLLAFHAALLFCFASNLQSEGVLRVRADSWMPYNGVPADAQPGYVVELLHRIFDPEKVTIDYQLLSWDER